MSATATADAAPPAKGKKKLVMIIAIVVVLALVGVGAMLALKKKPAEDGEEGADAGGHAPAAAAKHDAHNPPVFVPLEPFTVNLADRDSEHYAQVGITLEIDDAKTGEQIKVFMPAIRNNILMAIADRTSAELMGREGKTKLADKVRRETAKALGYEIEDEEADGDAKKADGHGDDDEDKPKKKKKKKAKKTEPVLPIRAVHFSNFIIQ